MTSSNPTIATVISSKAEPVKRDEVDWEQWFSDQYDLNERIDRAVAAMTEGKPRQARAALYAAVCEHTAEQMRVNL